MEFIRALFRAEVPSRYHLNRIVSEAIREWDQNSTQVNSGKLIRALMREDALLFVSSVCISEQPEGKRMIAYTDQHSLYANVKTINYHALHACDVFRLCYTSNVRELMIITGHSRPVILKWDGS